MFVRRWLVGLVGVVLMFGNVEAQAGGFLSADMFTDPVPVLMDLPWQPYVHAKAEVTPDGQHISFIKFPLPTQLYTAEWTWIASEGQYGWGNETHVPIKQMWAGGSCISPDKQWLF